MFLLNDAAFAKMKHGVRIVNCARGELIDAEALRRAIENGRVAGAALDVFQTEPPAAGEPLLKRDEVVCTPHIGGSTEEAQVLAGVHLAEHIIEYLQHGIAVNAVNVPVMSEEAFRAVAPFVNLSERLGRFAAHLATGNPRLVRMVYHGSISPQNTQVIRNAGLAGVLSRSMARKANVVNALKIAADRGLSFAERFERPSGQADSIRVELETDKGTTMAEGAIILDRPRLLSLDGIRVDAALEGHLLVMRNDDVPGVLGYIGNILGKHNVNIATLAIGRQETPERTDVPLLAVVAIQTDQVVPDVVINELLENKAIRSANSVEFRA
jgi:D-3-phosphoglycerate dehydrogenase